MISNFNLNLSNDLEEVCLPFHKSMRSSVYRHNKRAKRQYGYEYFHHCDKSFYIWICNFLKKSIGKDFKYVFKKIREKFSSDLKRNYSTPLNLLYNYVDKSEMPARWYRNSYYFDSEGLLRKYPSKKRDKSVKVVEAHPTSLYKIESNNWIVKNCIARRLGYKKYLQVVYDNEYISQDLAIKLILDLNSIGICGNDYILPVYKYVSRTYERGSRECSRYFAEKMKARKKNERERERQTKEESKWILYKIEAERKEKEEQLNIITRNRHGFDEESFIGEPYHGQKRKKRK